MDYDLYVITDEAIAGNLPHAGIARLAVAGGATVIQLRDKTRSRADLVEIGKEIRTITRSGGAGFIVNDYPEVALACGADGVHLGQGDMDPARARKGAPEGFIVGISVGSIAEARVAERAGADYVALSPTFSTGSKVDAGPGHGCAVLRDICSSVSIPVIAIGGITAANIPDVIRAGADGVAVISAVVAQPDIPAAARHLLSLVRAKKRERL